MNSISIRNIPLDYEETVWRWETVHQPEMPKPLNTGTPPKFPRRRISNKIVIGADESSNNVTANVPKPPPFGRPHKSDSHIPAMDDKIISPPKFPRRKVSAPITSCEEDTPCIPPKFPKRQKSVVEEKPTLAPTTPPKYPHRKTSVATEDTQLTPSTPIISSLSIFDADPLLPPFVLEEWMRGGASTSVASARSNTSAPSSGSPASAVPRTLPEKLFSTNQSSDEGKLEGEAKLECVETEAPEIENSNGGLIGTKRSRGSLL